MCDAETSVIVVKVRGVLLSSHLQVVFLYCESPKAFQFDPEFVLTTNQTSVSVVGKMLSSASTGSISALQQPTNLSH